MKPVCFLLVARRKGLLKDMGRLWGRMRSNEDPEVRKGGERAHRAYWAIVRLWLSLRVR